MKNHQYFILIIIILNMVYQFLLICFVTRLCLNTKKLIKIFHLKMNKRMNIW
jgi:hypothetical protein